MKLVINLNVLFLILIFSLYSANCKTKDNLQTLPVDNSVKDTMVILSTDFTSRNDEKALLYNIWSVANRISPLNGVNVRSDLKVNLIRMIGGINKKVNGQNVPDLDFDPCIYDSLTNTYIYNWEPLISRINKIVNSKTDIFQIVLDQPPWAFQHGYTFIPKGTRDNIHFREDERVTCYGNSLPPADKVAYSNFIKNLITKLVETYGKETVLTWRFRVGSEIETPDHWKGTEQDFIEYFANTEKAIRSVLPDAKIGVHTRPPYFVYKNGTVLNYKGEPIKSFSKDLIEYCYDNNVRYDFWGISDYVLINNTDSRQISHKYYKLFADMVNNPKWNHNAKLDLMEYSTITTMKGGDGKGFINCVTSHKDIVELCFAQQFYKYHNDGLEYIFRWGNRVGSEDPTGIKLLNTMVGMVRYETHVSGIPVVESNQLDAIFAKNASTENYDVLVYNFNSVSLDYKEDETVNIVFDTNLPIGTVLYYRDVAFGKEQNKLQNFLANESSSICVKDGFDIKGDPSRILNDSGVDAYSSYSNPNPYKFSGWKNVVTRARNDGKDGSVVEVTTKLPSFAFKKFEFRLMPYK